MALEMGTFFRRKPRERRTKDATDPFRASTTAPAATRTPPRTVMIERAGEGTMRLLDRLLAVKLPIIGDKPINTQVQVLLILLGFCFFVVVAVLFFDNRMAANGAVQSELVGDTLMHSQRLAKAAHYAVEGFREAFVELRESRDAIAANLDALANGDNQRNLSQSSPDIQPPLAKLVDRWRSSEAAASVIVANEKALIAFGDVIKKINDASPRL